MATTGEPFGLFWDSENGDRTYSAASFEYWLKKFFTSGVFNGDLQVKAKSGMTLEIDPGYTNVDGKVKFWNGAFTITLDAANSTYPRIDTIIIRRDNVNRQITCEKVTGSYSADTPQPTAPTRNSEIYDLVTAQIYVGAGVTEITQSNITDTRPNNELCGYITGTVEELDFSAFTAQFEAYFAEFKRNQMADFQAWEVAQQAAYAAWFSLVQQQQIQDKADWDAWYAALQEELHELPEDTAEYLQIQIDEIRTSGTTGSILKISTTETSLEGKTVTVTNGTETRTATFDENLECLIAGYKGTGEVTISSSDGIQTASTVVTIPYFGNYQYAIAFWAATVNIQGDDNLKGATITVKDSDDLTVGTVVLNVITGRGVFTAQKADTYTFNFTYQGTDYSESLIVDEQITYSLSLSAGFNWNIWVDTARFLDSTDYNSLDEVLADEEAVRELCLEHACVDYLARVTSATADVETIIENDLFAKWANNSDYSLDILGANTVIKALMDEADKYGYGEWVITDNTTTPPTWGAKGNVPIMTSNSAPYGTAGGDADTNSYLAFDGNDSTAASKAGLSTSAIIWYKFPTPTEIKRADFLISFSSAPSSISAQVIYSDDGVTWNDATEAIAVVNATKKQIDVEPQGYHLYWGIRRILSESKSGAGNTIQFYGRELSVSVPVMTANNAPYGEITVSSYLNNNNDYNGFRAFDATENGWDPATTDSVNNANLVYKFTSNVNPVMFGGSGARTSSSSGTNVIKLLVSKDGTTWVDTTKTISFDRYKLTRVYNTVNLNEGYKYFKFLITEVTDMSVSGAWGVKLFLYGKDYSEKEFEEGTTKKWLYDHGLFLGITDFDKIGTGGTVEKTTEKVKVTKTSSTSSADVYIHAVSHEKVDLSENNIMFAKCLAANTNANNTTIICPGISANKTSSYNLGGYVARNNIINGGPLAYIDVSAINEADYVSIGTGYSTYLGYAELFELWLE